MKHPFSEIALKLDRTTHSAKAVQQISVQQNISLEEAYEIQRISLEQRYDRGEKLNGFKLGFTSKAKIEQMGVHDLIWGRLIDQMKISSGDSLRRNNFIHPRVEPEIAFLIGTQIDKKINLAEATKYLDGVSAALEIIDSRYENFKFSLQDVIADNCSSAAYVLGKWMSPDTPVNNINIQLSINEEKNEIGNSNAILGNPLNSLVELSRIFIQNGQTIEAGTIVLAGAATPAIHVHPGDTIIGSFENFGTIELNVE